MKPEFLKFIILVVFGLTVLLVAIRRLRNYRLKERYALMLILLGTPFFILAVWQDAVGQLAEWMGIQYTTFSLLCVTAFLFVMIFELLTIVSVQEQKINTLSQMVGLLHQKQQQPSATSPDVPVLETRDARDTREAQQFANSDPE